MRIAIYENLPPGGARRTAYEFGRYLAQTQQVDLYRLGPTQPGAFDLSGAVTRVYEYPYRPLFGLLDRRLKQRRLAPRSLTLFGRLERIHRRIARDLVARGYDLVLAHTDSMTQSPYLLRWLPPGLGVYYCHEVLRVARELPLLQEHRRNLRRSRPPVGAFRVLEDRWVLARWQRADQVTVQSPMSILVNSCHTREQVWSAYGLAATVCFPGVDTEAFTPSNAGTRVNEVLSIGSPLEIKGHEMVIDALTMVQREVRPRLRIVAPSLTGIDILAARARRQEVELVFESGISDAALAERYRRALATICAARMEPLGLTPLESMASGTPVIAVREAGFRETVIDGETGLLVEPKVGDLACAIAKVVAERDAIERFGGRAREHVVRNWTWSLRGEQLLAELQAIAGRRRGAVHDQA